MSMVELKLTWMSKYPGDKVKNFHNEYWMIELWNAPWWWICSGSVCDAVKFEEIQNIPISLVEQFVCFEFFCICIYVDYVLLFIMLYSLLLTLKIVD